LLPEDSTVYLWPQNDPAGDKWQKRYLREHKNIVKRAKIRAPHKDLNDWTARATKGHLAPHDEAETIRDANNAN
jgi:hypothetical protein